MAQKILNLKNKIIGKGKPIFIIAEAGVNHNNNLSLAFKMIDTAKKSGADAIKFQTFKVDKTQLKNSIKPNYQKSIRKNYYDIIKSLETNFNDQKKIFEYCKKKKILFLSTPYDLDSVDFLFELGVKAFKISASDFTNHFLVEHVAKKRLPIFISTGLSSWKDVDSTINLLKKHNMLHKTILMQTTSDYPSKYDEINLRVIPEFSKKYDVLTGFSDHTPNDLASLGAIALGSCTVEKHFTLVKNLPGPDQSSSLNPLELIQWVNKIRIMEKLLGTNKKYITKSEKKNLSMKKILILTPASKGTKITLKHLLSLRGNKNGVSPLSENIKKIVGKKLKKNITKNTQFSWKFVR